VEVTFNRHQRISNDRSIHIVAHLTHTGLILTKSLYSADSRYDMLAEKIEMGFAEFGNFIARNGTVKIL